MELYATTGDLTYLKDGKVPVIGTISYCKRYTASGCEPGQVLRLHYATRFSDYFYFENGKLVYHSVSLATPVYLTSKYNELLFGKEPVTLAEFTKVIKETFVLEMLGF